MAGFKTHITFSTCLGCGYAAYGYLGQEYPVDTAIVGGALCGFSGMLPDIDSDFGVPLRETMSFAAAIVPMLLVGHLTAFDLSHDGMVLVAIALYLMIRFGLTRLIRRWTVHRGMFHSIPAGLIFAGIAFLLTGTCPVEIRYFKAGGVFLGFMSHLLLDEIYSVEWKGGRWQFKKSFGTAIKFWGGDPWANFSTYAKLAVVVVLLLGEPSVMARMQERNPQFAARYQRLQERFHKVGAIPGAAGDALGAARNAAQQFVAQARGFAEQIQSPSAPAAPSGVPPWGAPISGAATNHPPENSARQFSPFDQPPTSFPVPAAAPQPFPVQNPPVGHVNGVETAGRPWPQSSQ